MSNATGGAQYPSRMSYESGPMVFHYIVEHGVCYLTVTDRAYPKKLAYQYLSELQHLFDAEYRSQVRIISITPKITFSRRAAGDGDCPSASRWRCCERHENLPDVCSIAVYELVLTKSPRVLLCPLCRLCGSWRLHSLALQVDTVSRPYAFVRFDTAIQRTKKLYMDSRTQRNIDKLNEDLSEVHMVMTKNINEVLGQGEKLDHISRMTGDLASESKKYHSKARDLSRQALIKKYAPIAFVVFVVFLVFFLRHYFYK